MKVPFVKITRTWAYIWLGARYFGRWDNFDCFREDKTRSKYYAISGEIAYLPRQLHHDVAICYTTEASAQSKPVRGSQNLVSNLEVSLT